MVFLEVFSSFIRKFRAFFPQFKNHSEKFFWSHVPKMGTYGSKRLSFVKKFPTDLVGIENFFHKLIKFFILIWLLKDKEWEIHQMNQVIDLAECRYDPAPFQVVLKTTLYKVSCSICYLLSSASTIYYLLLQLFIIFCFDYLLSSASTICYLLLQLFIIFCFNYLLSSASTIYYLLLRLNSNFNFSCVSVTFLFLERFSFCLN